MAEREDRVFDLRDSLQSIPQGGKFDDQVSLDYADGREGFEIGVEMGVVDFGLFGRSDVNAVRE